MNHKTLLNQLGFLPKENASGVFVKKYTNDYCIEVDFEKHIFYFGGKIKLQGKDYQNITKPEDWVVLECINRLLERGYNPENVLLEKVYPAGHGYSGRLDICVLRDDGSEYLLIECKTYGKEFEKELARIKKEGGQLFTYFKFSNKANVVMLYASHLEADEIIYRNEIIKIDEDYRMGDVKDFYNAWDKKTYQNIVWENSPYNSEIKKSFTKANLKPLTQDQSDKIFHGFASILRKHSVSDKPNAFNKIFNLFLAKLYDEAKGDDMELEFHWREDDDPVDFQIRLINLHKNGLQAFLEKEVAGIDNSDFEGYNSEDELRAKKKKVLMFHNILTLKDVLDNDSFDENQRVLKEVVKLLENYQIRYPRKQQHLSDFFELLLTTGLKQEVGQYFTPPPVTKFIVRSLPIKKMMLQEINNQEPKLPAVIDYAAGSGHFITEALEEYQDIINNIDIEKELTFPKAKTVVKSWVEDPYNWAAKYVYGIEKDYRLVKVAKVGCYFYGDGVAQIIHGDGLDSFATSKTYKGLLKDNINIEDSSKAKFSVVISNPPYAVNDCKDDLEYIGAQNEYTLYPSLSDKSKDIECLFVERTKHLLKDGGVASLILPSSILNNTGIQTKTREIILQYFDIVAIAELGSNTFMATGTNTVTLFLRRRANKLSVGWKKSVVNFFETQIDITIKGIEKPVTKYVNHVWDFPSSGGVTEGQSGISFEDYLTLLNKAPNQAIQNHEIYKEYRKKLKAKTEKDFWNVVLEREADKIYYFIIAFNQKVVLVKSGEKEAEKRFLGYDFSSRRGSEGMHPMQRGKTVDECTQMYDAKLFDNPEKASTYILKAFTNVDFEIDAKMQNHISQHNLVDMITFDRVEFEKTISLAVKKKVKIESKWGIKKLGEITVINYGTRIVKGSNSGTIYPVYGGGGETFKADEFNRKDTFIISRFGMSSQCMRFVDGEFFLNDSGLTINSSNELILLQNYLDNYLFLNQEVIFLSGRGVAQKNLDIEAFNAMQIPLPPLDIQQKIVDEIEVLEIKEREAKQEIEKFKIEAGNLFNFEGKLVKLQDITTKIGSGATPRGGESAYKQIGTTLIRSMNVYDNEFYIKGLAFIDDEQAKKLNNVTVEENDILFNITGASVCRCCIVENKYLPARVNQHVSIIRTNEKALPKFVQQLLISSKFKTELLALADNSSTREAITKQQLEDFKIPLPPIPEQQKIVAEIEKIEAKINALQTEIAAIPSQKEAILKKYL